MTSQPARTGSSVTEPETPAARCQCGHTRPEHESRYDAPNHCTHRCAPPWLSPGAHPWENHDDSCDCHIGICMKCGCTNEFAEGAALAARPAEAQAGAGIDADELGFRDLLDLADAILTKYPPETIVCSHSVKADKGALTTAAIADLVASCRASLPTEPEAGE